MKKGKNNNMLMYALLAGVGILVFYTVFTKQKTSSTGDGTIVRTVGLSLPTGK